MLALLVVIGAFGFVFVGGLYGAAIAIVVVVVAVLFGTLFTATAGTLRKPNVPLAPQPPSPGVYVLSVWVAGWIPFFIVLVLVVVVGGYGIEPHAQGPPWIGWAVGASYVLTAAGAIWHYRTARLAAMKAVGHGERREK